MASLACFKTLLGFTKGKYKPRRSHRRRLKSSNHCAPAGAGSGELPSTVEVIAATRIQASFRAFMARKALRRLKGAAKLQAPNESRAAAGYKALNTLSYIHSWSRIQAEIRYRRLCMVTHARMKQKKLESRSKLETRLHELENAGFQVEWCGGSETMEEILSRIQQREEAAVKRERAMAYAFSHQWRANCSQYLGQTYYDVGKDSWGWSWTDRWISARPWEVRVHASPPATAKDGKTTGPPAVRVALDGKPAGDETAHDQS